MAPALARQTAAPPPSRRNIRLMIVDDSMVARAVLSRMVELGGGIEISAVAGTAEDAVEALAHVSVDVILLDLEMPGAGGLSKLPEIIAAARGARVLVVSSLAEQGAAATVAALAQGAADTLLKPGTGRFQGRFADFLLAKIRALGPVERDRESARPATHSALPMLAMGVEPLSLLALGASTGGIHALGRFFAELPPRIGVPLLVTQHLPVPFMDVFARQLSTAAGRPARIATDGAPLVADEVLIAPGDAHLTVEGGRGGSLRVRLVRGRAASGCLPSVDPMLASIAALGLPGAVAVILSGMGRDGVEGAADLVRAGGSVLVQDEATCAVWGMPRAVAEAGLAAAILCPEKLARRVASRIGQSHADK